MSIVRLYVDKWNQASEDGLDNGTEFEHKGFLQIDGYYFELSLGAVDWETMNYDLEIKDIAGADNKPEILLNSGCFSDAGCLDKSYLIITHEQEPFTVLDLEVPVDVDPYGEEGEVVITNEMYWIEDNDETNNSECYIIKESYRLTRYSLIKTNSYLERKKIECAG